MTVKNIEDNNKDIGERERERVTSRRLVMLERVMEEIVRGMKKAFLDWLKEFRRNSSTSQHVPEYQSLQLKLLPLRQAEVAPHP